MMMRKPDGWDWNISDYTDSHTGQTLYRVSVHDCRQPAACNLSGYATSDAAEAAARKWIAGKLGQGEVPTPVLPVDDKRIDAYQMVTDGVLALLGALRHSVDWIESDDWKGQRETESAFAVYVYRLGLLADLERSYQAQREAIRLRRNPDYYTEIMRGK